MRQSKKAQLSISLSLCNCSDRNEQNKSNPSEIPDSKSVKYGYEKKVTAPKRVTVPKAIYGVF